MMNSELNSYLIDRNTVSSNQKLSLLLTVLIRLNQEISSSRLLFTSVLTDKVPVESDGYHGFGLYLLISGNERRR